MPARVLLSWAWFFLVLLSYYVLKPLRDGLATENQSFGLLYLGTFLTSCVALPLYWRIVAATSRWQLVAGVHQFFVVWLVVSVKNHGCATRSSFGSASSTCTWWPSFGA